MSNPPSPRRLVLAALREDSYRRDITSAVIPLKMQAIAEIVAEERLVVSGVDVAVMAFQLCDSSVRILRRAKAGKVLRPGDVVLRVRGRARSILASERTALNFLAHLCGVASLTRKFVSAVPRNCRVKILDTRKTMPLLRQLEKKAVRAGGGQNHRMSLSEAILLKDNHVALVGGVEKAVRAMLKKGPRPVEVEVSTLADLRTAIDAGAHRVLLDNMSDRQIGRAVREARGKVAIEISGGITLERIPRLARLGVDFISVGALTHSAPSAKLSLDISRI